MIKKQIDIVSLHEEEEEPNGTYKKQQGAEAIGTPKGTSHCGHALLQLGSRLVTVVSETVSEIKFKVLGKVYCISGHQ